MEQLEEVAIIIRTDSEYRQYVKSRIDILVPVLAHSAVGDYSEDVHLEEADEEMGPIFAGVQFMLEAIREQMARITELEISAAR